MNLDTYLGIGKPEEKKEIRIEPCESKVVFEPKAVYEGNYKKLYSFDESLQALRKRGYERHPRPAEVFDLICRGLEGRLQPEQQAIADDMWNNYGEWLSLVIRRRGDKLHCYFDPENIRLTGASYVVQGDFKYDSKKVYVIQSLSGWVPIKEVNKVNPELVEILWSRPYAILPEEIRLKECLYLSHKDIIWPMSRGGNYSYYIGWCNYAEASRGVL